MINKYLSHNLPSHVMIESEREEEEAEEQERE